MYFFYRMKMNAYISFFAIYIEKKKNFFLFLDLSQNKQIIISNIFMIIFYILLLLLFFYFLFDLALLQTIYNNQL